MKPCLPSNKDYFRKILVKPVHLALCMAFFEARSPSGKAEDCKSIVGSIRPAPPFHFKPEQGIHSLHLNQGQSGRFSKDNGRNQDGMLLFENADLCSWTACFFAFQAQSWENDASGNPITT